MPVRQEGDVWTVDGVKGHFHSRKEAVKHLRKVKAQTKQKRRM